MHRNSDRTRRTTSSPRSRDWLGVRSGTAFPFCSRALTSSAPSSSTLPLHLSDSLVLPRHRSGSLSYEASRRGRLITPLWMRWPKPSNVPAKVASRFASFRRGTTLSSPTAASHDAQKCTACEGSTISCWRPEPPIERVMMVFSVDDKT